MRKLESFFQSERKRLEKTEAPRALDDTLLEAFVAAGLSKEEIQAVEAAAENKKEDKPGSRPAKSLLSPEHRKKRTGLGRFWLPAVAACVAFLLLLTSILPLNSDIIMLDSLPESFQGVITVAPLSADDGGIDPEEGFLLSSTEALDQELVEKALVIEPSVSYTLERKKGGSEYLILPREPLDSGSVYKISFDPQNTLADQEARAAYTWAFQTKSEFDLSAALPANYSQQVPVDTVIELNFGRRPEADSLDSRISIVPATAGSWRIEGTAAIFVPAEPLAADTVYRVLVDGTLTDEGGDTLGQTTEILFRTAPAEEASPVWNLNLETPSFAVQPGEAPEVYFNLYSSGGEKADDDLEIEVELYQYAGGDQFKSALALQAENSGGWVLSGQKDLSTEGLEPVLSFTAQSFKTGYRWQLFYPQGLPAGFYLAEYTLGGAKAQQLIQATELSAYLVTNQEEALLWVQDLAKGVPAAGAALAVGDYPGPRTDEQGIAYFEELPQEEGPLIFTIHSENRLLYVAGNSGYSPYYYGRGQEENQSISRDYWYYLSLDKPLYRPGESLRFFGLAASRTQGSPELTEVTLKLNLRDSHSLIQHTYAVEEGVVSGEFPLPVLQPGYYSLEMYSGDSYICSSFFEVATYEKPSYQLTFSADKEGVMAGEIINWKAATTFFDGSPLPEQPVEFSGSGIESSTAITSDSNGEIRFTTRAEGNSGGYLVSRDYVSATAMLPEIGEVYRSGEVWVLNNDLDIEGRVTRSEENSREFTFEMELFSVDASRVEDWSNSAVIQEAARQPYQGELTMQVQITREYWERIETGQRVDPYTKQVEPVYEYVYQSVEEPEITWQLAGAGQATFQGSLESEDAYQIRVSAKDRSGRSFYRDYYLPPTEKGSKNPDSDYIWLQRKGESGYVEIGETVEYQFYSQDAPLEGEGQCLFFTSRDRITDYQVSEENRYLVQFTQGDLPGLNISGVYFDGQSYRSVAYATMIIMDPAQRALDLKITPDRESYAPGDQVNLELVLTDREGNPRQGTVNLNILDEALLTLEEMNVDMESSVFLGNLYPFDYSFTVMNGDSILGPMAEGGGDGGYRENFQDSALYTTVTTDRKGRAEIRFTLPDNITSWRAVWQAYVPDIWVGSGSERIIAGLPFFTDLRFNGPLLAGDQAVLGLRGAGTALTSQAEIAWQVSIPEADFVQELSGSPFSWQEMKLPVLTAGDYTLVVEATCLSYQDAVRQSFRVLDTRQSYQERNQSLLTESTAVQGAEAALTKLIFSDQKRAQSLEGLLDLAAQDTVRLEQRIAALQAGELLDQVFDLPDYKDGEEEASLAKEEILKYQNNDGGIGYLPYGQSDPYVSVWAASLGGEYFSKTNLSVYFTSLLESENQDPTLALWGLAVSGQPVLTEIRKALDSGVLAGTALKGEQKLNLVCGLLFAGDGNYALSYMEQLLAEWTEDLGEVMRAKVSEDRQETIRATAQMAAAAGLLELPEAEKLYAYVLQNKSDENPCLLEQLAYLRGNSLRLPEESGFCYTLDGKTTEISLTKSPAYTLSLTPEEARSIRFSQVKGQVMMTSVYEKSGRPETAANAAKELSLTRSYQVGGLNTSSLPTTGKIQVVLEYGIGANAPDGYYEIVDYLPAGLRYINLTEDPCNDRINLLEEKENRLRFGVEKFGEGVSGQLRFYVRVAMPGSYLTEPASLAKTGQPTVYTATEEGRIYIN